MPFSVLSGVSSWRVSLALAFCFLLGLLCRRHLGKFFLAEEQGCYHRTAHRSIGKIEYRREEDKLLASYAGHPVRIIRYDKGEIEHVHHFACEETGITLAEGYALRHNARRRFCEA